MATMTSSAEEAGDRVGCGGDEARTRDGIGESRGGYDDPAAMKIDDKMGFLNLG